MNHRGWLYVLFSYLPAFAVLALITQGFQKPVSAVWLLLPLATAICFQIILLQCIFCRSIKDLINAIRRAINGDYRARFDCDESSPLKPLGIVYNQLMGCVESQTDELSENRILQNQMYENEKIYRSALELTCERVFEADLSHNRILYGYEKYAQTFPYLNTKIYDEMISAIAAHSVFQGDAKEFRETFARSSLLKSFHRLRTPEVAMDYRLILDDGSCAWYSASVIFLNSSSQTGLKIIGYIKNIDERKKQELEILNESQKDGLTGLFNKKVTESMIDGYLADKGKDGHHAMIMLDIDNFKYINDSFGHTQGDAALTHVSHQLQHLFRTSDIVGRVGGDEFLILMKNVSDTNALFEKLHSMQSEFHKIRLEDTSYRLHSSIGVSLYPDDDTSYASLFKKADMALYYSKAHGKDQFCLYADHYEKDGTPKSGVPETLPRPLRLLDTEEETGRPHNEA